jgi:hypothetical protein
MGAIDAICRDSAHGRPIWMYLRYLKWSMVLDIHFAVGKRSRPDMAEYLKWKACSTSVKYLG